MVESQALLFLSWTLKSTYCRNASRRVLRTRLLSFKVRKCDSPGSILEIDPGLFQSINPHVYNPPPPKGIWMLPFSTLSKSKVALYEMMHTAVCLVSMLCHNFFGGSIELRHVVISGKVQYKLFFICLSSFEHFCLQILLCTVVLRHKVLALSVETLCLVHAILPENFWIYFTFFLKSIWSFQACSALLLSLLRPHCSVWGAEELCRDRTEIPLACNKICEQNINFSLKIYYFVPGSLAP